MALALRYIPDNWREAVLGKYSQEQLFSLAFGDIDFNEKVRNPLREDKNPGAWFEYIGDTLYFRDFAYGNRPLDVFEFLSLYYDIPIYELYEYLYNLDQEEIPKKDKDQKVTRKSRRKKQKEVFGLTAKPTEWDNQNIKFWSELGISKETLMKESVFPVTDSFIGTKHNYEILAYVKLEERGDCFKLYRPLNKEKFRTNCGKNVVGCKNTLDYSKSYIIITKSFKDCVLLKEFKLNTVYFQSENTIPQDLSFLRSFKYIYILYDNDTAGKIHSRKLQRILLEEYPDKNVKRIFFRSAKDASDVVKARGIKHFKKELKEIMQ